MTCVFRDLLTIQNVCLDSLSTMNYHHIILGRRRTVLFESFDRKELKVENAETVFGIVQEQLLLSFCRDEIL